MLIPPPESKAKSKEDIQTSSFCFGTPCRERIYRWARRFVSNHDDAEDIRQEVCLRCLLRQATFRGEAQFATWLHRVMVSVCQDFLRKKRRRQEATETEMGEEAFRIAQAVQAQIQAASEETAAIVDRAQAALAQLMERQRQPLEWKYVEHCSHAEIARRLGVTERSARVILHHARAAFKKAYEALYEDSM